MQKLLVNWYIAYIFIAKTLPNLQKLASLQPNLSNLSPNKIIKKGGMHVFFHYLIYNLVFFMPKRYVLNHSFTFFRSWSFIIIFPKTRSYLDKTSSYLDKTRSYLDKTSSYLDNTRLYLDKTRSYMDKTRSYLEKNRSYLDKTSSYLENTRSYLDKTRSYLKKTRT